MGEAKERIKYHERMATAFKRWKEENPKMDLKIIFEGNLVLIGEYIDNVQYHILKNPRAVTLGQDAQGRGLIGLQRLIGEPKEVRMFNASMIYNVEDEKVINLYIQDTTGIIPAKSLTNVFPIKGRDN